MRHTYYSVLLHITFSTHQRQKTIAPEIRGDLHAYLGGIAKHLDCVPINVGGVDDHVHLLLSMPPTRDIATLTEKLKSNSSRWAHDRGWKNLWWQRGYGAFSVSPTMRDRVTRYIANQETHHRTLTFEEEFERLLGEAGVRFDRDSLFG